MPGGVELQVKVHPRSRRPGIGGLAPDGAALRIAVTEAPEGGRANEAACAMLAKTLGVSTSAVTLIQGAASRRKTLTVAGDPVLLGARLEGLLA